MLFKVKWTANLAYIFLHFITVPLWLFQIFIHFSFVCMRNVWMKPYNDLYYQIRNRCKFLTGSRGTAFHFQNSSLRLITILLLRLQVIIQEWVLTRGWALMRRVPSYHFLDFTINSRVLNKRMLLHFLFTGPFHRLNTTK